MQLRGNPSAYWEHRMVSLPRPSSWGEPYMPAPRTVSSAPTQSRTKYGEVVRRPVDRIELELASPPPRSGAEEHLSREAPGHHGHQQCVSLAARGGGDRRAVAAPGRLRLGRAHLPP